MRVHMIEARFATYIADDLLARTSRRGRGDLGVQMNGGRR